MAMSSRTTIVGVFEGRVHARSAVAELRTAGFREDQIGVVGKNSGDDSGLENDPTESRWEEGTGIGAAAGAVTGTGLGLAVAAGLIPGIGPAIAGGALMALLASAGAGATVGTVLGGLVGLGIPEDEASYYEGEFRSGRTLVTVKTDGARTDEAYNILRRHGAYDMHTSAAGTAGTATSASGRAI